MTQYLMRSLLFIPAHDERLMQSALRTDADVLLPDLEDSVQPVSNKQVARDLIIKYVANSAFKQFLVFPRVNERESGQLLKDLYQLTIAGIHGFMYPKSKGGEDLYFVDKLLETIEYEKGFPIGTFKLIPIIETAAAVLNAQEICRASQRVIAIAFGCGDFIADIEGILDPEYQSIFTPRALTAMAARANNVIPVDTVHIQVHDLGDLEDNLIISKKLGFEGMMVLHPKELPLVHRYFSPTEQELADARTILSIYEKAKKENKGVVLINKKFIGPPIVAGARKVINRYELIKSKQIQFPLFENE